jgi:LuxR family maltose regulon positive regulatory protein
MMTFHYKELVHGNDEADIAAIWGTPTAVVKPSLRPIITEKLELPDVSGMIPRRRLMTLLGNSTATFPATLIMGRAGTGKTAAAAEFARTFRRAAWYSLGPGDVDWQVFSAHFAAAVAGRERGVPPTAEETSTTVSRAAIERFIAGCLNEVRLPDVLVIDDIHHIFDAPWFEDALLSLISLVSPSMRLVLTCRSRPPAPLWRSRSKQQLNVIDEKQLAFDHKECTELFATHGLSAAAAADAHRRTYGRAARLAQAVTSL